MTAMVSGAGRARRRGRADIEGGMNPDPAAIAGHDRTGRGFMTIYFLVKYLHVLGAVVILGTGSGIAFFMLMAHRSGDAAFIAKTASVVVIADMLFTATAVIAQPVTGD